MSVIFKSQDQILLIIQTKNYYRPQKLRKKIQEGKESMLEVLGCKANTQASSIRYDNHYSYENLENGKETIEYLNVACSLQINLNTMI